MLELIGPICIIILSFFLIMGSLVVFGFLFITFSLFATVHCSVSEGIDKSERLYKLYKIRKG